MKTALVAVVIAAMAVASAGLMQTPRYEASAQMLVDWQQESQRSTFEWNGKPLRTLEYREPPNLGITHAIDSRRVAEETIQRLQLQMDPDELLDKLTVEEVEGTMFLHLRYEDTDPERARQIVNTLAEVSSEFISDMSVPGILTATVYEKAAVPDSPVSPHPVRNGLLTLVVGLALCAGGVVHTARGGEPRQRLAAWYSNPNAVERIKEQELLRALDRRGKLTAASASLATSLSVEEANRMLFDLAARGHLEVTVEDGKLLYSFWEHGA